MASSWVAAVDDVLVGAVLVIVESFVPAQILQACRVLQGSVLDAAVHAKPVSVLHTVRLRGPLGRRLVAVAVGGRRQVARVGVRSLAGPRNCFVGLMRLCAAIKLVPLRAAGITLRAQPQIVRRWEVDLLRPSLEVARKAFLGRVAALARIVRAHSRTALICRRLRKRASHQSRVPACYHVRVPRSVTSVAFSRRRFRAPLVPTVIIPFICHSVSLVFGSDKQTFFLYVYRVKLYNELNSDCKLV